MRGVPWRGSQCRRRDRDVKKMVGLSFPGRRWRRDEGHILWGLVRRRRVRKGACHQLPAIKDRLGKTREEFERSFPGNTGRGDQGQREASRAA